MRKTHTKNLLSMGPTLQMFNNKISKQQRTLINNYNESTAITSKNINSNFHINTNSNINANSSNSNNNNNSVNNLNMNSSAHSNSHYGMNVNINGSISGSGHKNVKYNRSISSFRKIYQDSPDKKFSASGNKSRPTLPKGTQDLHPFEKIVQVLGYDINARSEESLHQDVVSRIESAIRILQDSLQSQSIIRIFKQLLQYFNRILSIYFKLSQKQLVLYCQQFKSACIQYENKLKQVKNQTKKQIIEQLLYGESEIGKKIQQLKCKASFSTKLLNQMERNHINVLSWVQESQTLDHFIAQVEGMYIEDSYYVHTNQRQTKQIVNENKQEPESPKKQTKQKERQKKQLRIEINEQNFEDEFQGQQILNMRGKQTKTIQIKNSKRVQKQKQQKQGANKSR